MAAVEECMRAVLQDEKQEGVCQAGGVSHVRGGVGDCIG